MDPITLSILALAILGGGGYFLYEKFGPGAKTAPPVAPPARQITLDANLPSQNQQAVIAAIMTQSSPATLTQMAAQYASYPWANYELLYRGWELNGKQGVAPAQPASGGTAVPTPAPAAPTAPATPAAPAAPVSPSQVATAAAPSSPPPPSAGPFDLSHASIHGAWQNDSAYIRAYQGALTFLAYKFKQPSWDPQGITGAYGATTAAAVMAFQAAKGLTPVDGEAGIQTATAMAAALTAQTTSGQGSYPAFPGTDGTGPDDSRYGARMQVTMGLGEGVQGLGEGVQGLGEGVQGLGEGVQGLGEGVQGLGEGVQGLGEGVQGLGEGVQGLGEGVQGLGEDNVQGLAVQAVGAAARPKGGWHVRVREQDRVWPRKLVEIGSGVPRGVPGSLQHLADINPHLAQGGVIRQFAPGDEVNVPSAWAVPLKQKGFDVRPDDTGVL